MLPASPATSFSPSWRKETIPDSWVSPEVPLWHLFYFVPFHWLASVHFRIVNSSDPLPDPLLPGDHPQKLSHGAQGHMSLSPPDPLAFLLPMGSTANHPSDLGITIIPCSLPLRSNLSLNPFAKDSNMPSNSGLPGFLPVVLALRHLVVCFPRV